MPQTSPDVAPPSLVSSCQILSRDRHQAPRESPLAASGFEARAVSLRRAHRAGSAAAPATTWPIATLLSGAVPRSSSPVCLRSRVPAVSNSFRLPVACAASNDSERMPSVRQTLAFGLEGAECTA